MFAGFEERRVRVNGVEIALVQGGTGPALLLLHGHPQTHAIWHKVAGELATRFSVVATDLRGYGDSSKPEGLPDHGNYSKRVMAQDQSMSCVRWGSSAFSWWGTIGAAGSPIVWPSIIQNVSASW